MKVFFLLQGSFLEINILLTSMLSILNNFLFFIKFTFIDPIFIKIYVLSTRIQLNAIIKLVKNYTMHFFKKQFKNKLK